MSSEGLARNSSKNTSSGAGTPATDTFVPTIIYASPAAVCTLYFVRWPSDVSCVISLALSSPAAAVRLVRIPRRSVRLIIVSARELFLRTRPPPIIVDCIPHSSAWLHPEQALQLLPRRWAKWCQIQCRLYSRIDPELPLSLNVRALGLIGGTLGRGLLIAVGRRGRGYLYLPQLNGSARPYSGDWADCARSGDSPLIRKTMGNGLCGGTLRLCQYHVAFLLF